VRAALARTRERSGGAVDVAFGPGICQTVRPDSVPNLQQGAVDDFAHRVMACTTLDGVGQQLCTEIARHGYTSSICRATVPSQRGAESLVLFRNWPRDWATLSDRENFSAFSPVIAEARKRMTPFTWLEVQKARTLSAAEQGVWDASFAWGWKNGFVLPVHGPGGYFATISMSSLEHDLDLGPENRLRLQIFAMLAHERAHFLASPERPLDKMSAREVECLRWVAAGKTDWEIGMILSISSATVKFHLDSARTKLGARTRAQAVAQLVLRGLH
jgi:DNA-binding CsgD family transcriptional regulator